MVKKTGWTTFTLPRRPKNRLDFCGGFRFTHSYNQTNVQIGSARRYFQIMLVVPRSRQIGYLHFSLRTPKGKPFWLRLSTRLRLWLIVLGPIRVPRVSDRG